MMFPRNGLFSRLLIILCIGLLIGTIVYLQKSAPSGPLAGQTTVTCLPAKPEPAQVRVSTDPSAEAHLHNIKTCDSSSFGMIGTSLLETCNRFWVYEYSGQEQARQDTNTSPVFNGKFFISGGELSLQAGRANASGASNSLKAFNTWLIDNNTLQRFTNGKMYYVMSEIDLDFSCSAGLRLPPTGGGTASSVQASSIASSVTSSLVAINNSSAGTSSDMMGGMSSDPMGGMSSDPMGGMSSDPMGGMSSDPMGGMSSDPMGGMSSDPMGGMSSDPGGDFSGGPSGDMSGFDGTMGGDMSGFDGTMGGDGTNLSSQASSATFTIIPSQPANNITSSADEAGNVGHYASMIGSEMSSPMVSYYDVTNGDLKLYRCADENCETGTSTVVDSDGDVGRYSSVALSTDGLPIISYWDVDNNDLKVATCGDFECTVWTTRTLDSEGSVGWYTSIAIGDDGLPIISYYDESTTSLKIYKCGSTNCSALESTDDKIVVVNSYARPGWYTSMVIPEDGKPVISYYQRGARTLEVAKCGNADCSTNNTISVVDGTQGVGLYSSIAIAQDGYPIISYHDDTRALMVAKCHDATCSSSTTRVLDSAGNTGRYTSIAIASNGKPVISYVDWSNLSLKVFKCGNNDCSQSGNDKITTVAAHVWHYTSIIVGMEGKPFISYYDDQNNDLKIMKCVTASCGL